MGQKLSHEELHYEVVNAFKSPRMHPLFVCSSSLGGNGTYIVSCVARGEKRKTVPQLIEVNQPASLAEFTRFSPLVLSLPHLNPCVSDGDLVAVKFVSLQESPADEPVGKYCLFATGALNPVEKQGVSIQEYLTELEILNPFVHDDRKPPPIDEILQGNIPNIPAYPRLECQGKLTKDFVESFLERLYECKVIKQDPSLANVLTGKPKEIPQPSLPLQSNDVEVVLVESSSVPSARRGSQSSEIASLAGALDEPTQKDGQSRPPSKKTRRWMKRHANLVSVRSVEDRSHAVMIATDYHIFNLHNLLKFSRRALLDSSVKASFVLYQLLHVLQFCHQRGISHGSLRPEYILFTKDLWLQLTGFQCTLFPPYSMPHYRRSWGIMGSPLPPPIKGHNILESITERWYYGELSNFDYLLALNELSGRKFGNASYHPVFPWIMDFTSPMGGWRDFRKSKFRMVKGDEQLDVTYNSPNPHHITDLLTDVSYYIYVARRTPIPVLTRFVRSIYIPNEYPLSMKRMYEWTPDECIPEFYTCPDIFVSMHSDMPDLAIPEWASDNQDFIRKHRMALESQHVSQNLHFWIDLTFGYQLSGQHAIDAKNVTLSDSPYPKNHGFVQLFKRPHIARMPGIKVDAIWGIVQESTRKPPPPREGFEWMRDALRHLTAHNTRSSKSQSSSNASGAPSPFTQVRRDLERPSSQSPVYQTALMSPGVPSRSLGMPQGGSFTSSDAASVPYMAQFRSPSAALLEKTRKNSVLQENLDRFSKKYLPLPTSDLLRVVDPKTVFTNPGVTGNPPVSVRYSELTLQENRLVSVMDPLKTVELGRAPGLSKTDPIGCYAPPKAESEYYDYPPTSITQLSSGDMFSVGCILAEMHLGYPLFTAQAVRQYFYEGILPAELDMLPHYIRPVVLSLIDPIPYSRPSATNLLKSNFFPPYFMLIHKFLSKMHFTTEYSEKMQLIMAHNADLSNLPLEGFQLILPALLSIFENGESLPYIPLIVFDMIGSKLGPVRAQAEFMQPIVRLFQVLDNTELQCSLIGRKFIYCAIKTFGLAAFLDQLLPYILDALRSKDESVRRLASQNIIHLCTNLGSVMTLTYIVQPLLQHLTRKSNPENIIHTLVCVGAWMGEKAVVRYYIPTLFQLLQTHSVKSSRGEPVLIVVLTLIEKLSNIMSPSMSLEVFVINSKHIFRLLLNPSPKSGLMKSIASTLLIICRKIGSENTKKHVLPYLQQFFQNYSELYQEEEISLSRSMDNVEHYRAIYTPEIAHQLYSGFSDLLGPDVLRKELDNSALIEKLLEEYQPRSKLLVEDTTEERNMDPFTSSASTSNIQGTLRFNIPKEEVEVIGPDEKDFDVLSLLRVPVNEDDEVENIANRNDWMQDVDTIFSLRGHTSPVRFIDVRDDEQFFVTGSKDATVKLWKTFRRNCLRIYSGHKNPIVCNRILDSGASVASCDQTIHIWDAETAQRTNIYEGGTSVVSGNPILFSFFHIAPHHIGNVLVAGTQDCNIRILDRRAPLSNCEWRLSVGAGSPIRSLYADAGENWLAVGHGTGHLSILDFRTGHLLSSFRAHDGPLTHLQLMSASFLLSSSNDKTVALWDISKSLVKGNDTSHQEVPPATIPVPSLVSIVKGHHDNVLQFVSNQNQMISCSGGRISYVNFTELISEYNAPQGFF
eukprot:TRINITY_DN7938_c0_g1_i1.p1 TRINITY_DN7938_c0_g1~~TRINITY_DN7938_c0_g1_i1.p1  ORF type:complete len:1662 (-),score=324.39 TRINITY_DN7938_c0_g1_i1:465-5450(-)